MTPRRLVPCVAALIGLFGCTASSVSVSAPRPVGRIAGAVVTMCSPANGVLVAATEDTGVVRSTDGGAHWAPWSEGLRTHYVSALAANTHGDCFAATLGSGIYRRVAGAAAWERVDTSAPQNALLRAPSLTVSPVDNTVFVGTLEHGVYHSTDGGSTWRNDNVGLGIFNINAIAVTRTNTAYVRCVGGGIFRRAHQWNEWQPVNKGLDDPYVTTAAAEPSGTVLLGTRNGKVYELSRGEDEWNDISADLPGYYVTTVAATAEGSQLAATKSGLYRYNASTNHWSPADPSLATTSVRALIVAIDGTVYAGAEDGSIFRVALAAQ